MQHKPLFTRLSGKYHLVAPDCPGFGHSDWPGPKEFAYIFDHIAHVMDAGTAFCSVGTAVSGDGKSAGTSAG